MQVKSRLEAMWIQKAGKENWSLGFFLVNLSRKVFEKIKCVQRETCCNLCLDAISGEIFLLK